MSEQPEEPTESVLERTRRRRAELAAAGDPMIHAAKAKVFDPATIPQSEPEPERADDDLAAILDKVDIVQAYALWCGKMEPALTGKVEGIMVSCPQPDHPDTVPSAWLNSVKGTWFCGGCQVGGDMYDIAAMHFDIPDYKGKRFPELRRAMAESLGYTVTRAPGADVVTKDVRPALTLVPPADVTPEADVPELHVSIDWRALIPEDTPLRRWMDVCSKDDLPDEFYLWEGLMAVGFAAADTVTLADNPIVKANFNLVLYGPSGIGKTRAMRALEELLEKAMPYDYENPASTGICHISQPASAEALLDSFCREEYEDPYATHKKVIRNHQVRGWLRIDEMSELMGKANRTGAVLKPLLMRLYDGYTSIDQNSRAKGYIKAERPFCSVITTTQPGVIRDLLVQNDRDSGFINRWVFAAGEPKKLVAIGREALDIDSVVPLFQRLRTWSSCGRQITLDPEAKARWEQFFADVLEPIKTRHGESSLLIRCDLTLKKMMLLFAINERKIVVDVDLVERVLILWPYLRDTYEALSGQIGLGEYEECRQAVRAFIIGWERDHGRGPTVRDVSTRVAARFSRKLVRDVLDNLSSMGEISAPTLTKGGRYQIIRGA